MPRSSSRSSRSKTSSISKRPRHHGPDAPRSACLRRAADTRPRPPPGLAKRATRRDAELERVASGGVARVDDGGTRGLEGIPRVSSSATSSPSTNSSTSPPKRSHWRLLSITPARRSTKPRSSESWSRMPANKVEVARQGRPGAPAERHLARRAEVERDRGGRGGSHCIERGRDEDIARPAAPGPRAKARQGAEVGVANPTTTSSIVMPQVSSLP